MNILAFDASSVSGSVCVSSNGKVLAEAFVNTSLTHSVTLLDNIKRVLAQAEMTVSGIDKIAVTVGPGSFTGIKIGVSCAKGLAFAENKPCIAVSSLEAAAANLPCMSGIVVSVMDARRQSFYNAVFENGRRICPDRQISAEELLAELPADKQIILVGDGAAIFGKYCAEHGREDITVAPDGVRYVRSASVAYLAENGRGEEVSHLSLVPVYLRAPQAERERLEKLKKIINK